jgi:hypothetical protein
MAIALAEADKYEVLEKIGTSPLPLNSTILP